MQHIQDLIKALKLVKEECAKHSALNTKCDLCPFFKNGFCGITDDEPLNWNIPEPITRLLI